MTSHPLATLSVLDRFASAPFPPGQPADHRTFSSPLDDVAGAVELVVRSAQRSLVVAMYAFTHPALVAAVIACVEAGYPVLIVLDRSQFGGPVEQRALSPLVALLGRSNLRLSVGDSQDGRIMHDKVCVVDGTVCVTGSFNWSESAVEETNQCTVGVWPVDAALLTASIEATYQYQITHDAQPGSTGGTAMNVGDIVVFDAPKESNGTREQPAIVTRVWGSGGRPTVNLKVFPDCGDPSDATSVQHLSACPGQTAYRYRGVGTRAPGKRGVRESHAPHLALSRFRTSGLPTPPESGDVAMGLASWGMLGNAQFGDCGPAATEHGRMAKALVSVTGGVPTYETGFSVPGAAYTEGLYFSYGRAQGEPGTRPDAGVTNATWLRFLYDNGLVDWYGELDTRDPDEIHAVMLACKGVLVAVQLPSDAETQFAAHEPWTLDSAGIEGGHDVLLVAYTPRGETFVTWGALQDATVDWTAACVTDAWAFGTREDAERAGYTFAAIKAAIDAAGGSVAEATPPATL